MRISLLVRLTTQDEVERARRYASSADQHRFLARRALQRLAAARWMGAHPDKVAIARQCPFCLSRDHGPPRVDRAPEEPVTISSSSSGNRVVVAVSQGGSVGVDVEQLTSSFPLPIDDRHVFSEQERRALQSAPLDEVDQLGYQIWVRKEAVAKCLVLGLTAPLPNLKCWRNGSDWVTASTAPYVVAYRDLPLGAGYVAAVASSNLPTSIVRIDWDEAALTLDEASPSN
jgi:4'-phosphopantetheinyl transferase